MIKARATGDNGAPMFILGLSEGNLVRLREKKPMLIDLGAMGGPPGSAIVILYGATEETVLEEMRAAGWSLPGDPGWTPEP